LSWIKKNEKFMYWVDLGVYLKLYYVKMGGLNLW